MKNENTSNTTPEKQGPPRAVDTLRRRGRKYLDRLGMGGRCRFDVERRGKWFVVRGRVDSHGTKVRLLSMIPQTPNNEQWIVDKLRVGVLEV